MTAVGESMSQGWHAFQRQDYRQAEQAFRRVLAIQPDHADALYLLGVIAFLEGRPRETLQCVTRAIALRPNMGAFYYHQALACEALGQHDEALSSCRQAIQLSPEMVEAHNTLGNIYARLEQWEEAARFYRQALQVRPDYAEAHNNLGIVLREVGRFAEAEANCRRALELKPDYTDALNNLGIVLRDLGKLEEAEVSCRRALELKPDYPDALNNLGIVLEDLDRSAEAEGYLRRAVELQPDYPRTHDSLGKALLNMGRVPEAMQSFRRAIELKPDDAEFHASLAVLMLLMGDYEHGLPEYEWRWKLKELALPICPQPLWDGSSLAGKTILLHPEQGNGDTIHCIRYAALVKQRGATVLFYCPRRLLTLMRSCPGIDRLVAQDEPPPAFDVHAPLLSLPRIFGTTVSTIPAPIPYLSADAVLVKQWRSRLTTVPGFKVGIVWQGAKGYRRDRQRSVFLTRFESLARVPGVTLISLQKGEGAEQVAALKGRFAVLDWGPELDETSGPFMDTAALLICLDLVITVDTAMVHLAGALGARTWLAQSFMPHWPWMLGRDDSPWYPTVRLFRQLRPGDWGGVFERMARELRQLAPRQ